MFSFRRKRLGVSSIEPDDGGDEVNGSEEVTNPFVIAGSDSVELLQSDKEVFDQVTRLVEFPVIRARILAGGNDGELARLFQRVKDALVAS